MSFSRKPKTLKPDEVDPSVYYYDEVYDELKNDKKVTKSNREEAKDTNRESKYMKGLLETAELRKTEKELRKFKKYTRDREKVANEGNVSEEVYLTSAYQKKLKEVEALEKERTQQLDREKDDSMNFLKQTLGKAESNSETIAIVENLPSDRKTIASAKVAGTSKEGLTGKTTADRPRCKPLKTSHDRKRYLQEVLAKRTVGFIYEEAVQRFIKRRSN